MSKVKLGPPPDYLVLIEPPTLDAYRQAQRRAIALINLKRVLEDAERRVRIPPLRARERKPQRRRA